MGKEHLSYLNQAAEMVGLSPINAQRIINNDDPWDTSVGKRIFIQDEKEVLTEYLSDGFKSFNSLRFNITETLTLSSVNNAEAIFVIIEQPEDSLHPDLQKKIPCFINEFINSLDSKLRSKINFFISTHSPFIISAASQFIENQKIYLMKDGHLLNLDLDKTTISTGHKGHECAWVAGQMLGGDITDLGYPENYAILVTVLFANNIR